MRRRFSKPPFSPSTLSGWRFPAGNPRLEETPSGFAATGLSAEVLAALPREARREYLAAYHRAQHLVAGVSMPDQGGKRINGDL